MITGHQPTLREFQGHKIEAAVNPATRRLEAICPESEGYDDADKLTLRWVPSHGVYVTVPA
jgi:hypothetical protein